MAYRFLRFPQGKYKAVTFSYDDGVRQDIRLSDILTKYNLKGTFNINSGFIPVQNESTKLSVSEIQKHILSVGHEVAIHGAFHKAPGNCTDLEIINDILECRKELETHFSEIITGMAYPDCGIRRVDSNRYSEIKNVLISLGISYARTLGEDNNNFNLPSDWYAWMPTAHHDNKKILSYADEFLDLDTSKLYSADWQPRLFYVWGHSYEFDQNDNWNHFDTLCSKLSNKNDIWYATNIEICNYVKAYNSLIFNAENTKVFNPTIYDIWFCYNSKIYCIKAGEMLNYGL